MSTPSDSLAPETVAPASIPIVARFLKPLEAVSALLLTVIIIMLLVGVCSRYVFSIPIVWIDEVVSLSFLWLAMIGSAIAMHRNEHLRLTLFLQKFPPHLIGYINAIALVAVAAFLIALIHPAVEYAREEWFVVTPALNIPNTFRVSALAFGIISMLFIILAYAQKTATRIQLIVAVLLVGGLAGVFWLTSGSLVELGQINILIFMVGLVALCLVAGVPIGFCFGLGALSYLAFATTAPLMVMIGRMDEGMSSLILVSVPIFVLLGCVLDATGMGKAIVDFMASLLGHVRAGMSYVLLGSLFIVSGISGSKVSDMATVAPALFPEMKRRGHKPKEMIALLATGAAMADTVPPSIVLIVLGSVAGVSIAGLFQSGFVIADRCCCWRCWFWVPTRKDAATEHMDNVRRAPVCHHW